MKCFNIFVTVLSLLISTGAVVTRPDAVLDEINALEVQAFEYQASVRLQVKTLRSSGGQISGDAFNKTLAIIENNIRNISASNNEINSTLAALNQNACVKNLVNTFNEIVELTGFAISNCIDLQNGTSVNSSIDAESLRILDTVENDINNIATIIINSFIGRNIWTEGNSIVDRIEERYESTKAEINAALDQIRAKSSDNTDVWNGVFKELQTCFSAIDMSIESAVTFVKALIPICTLFGARGARSAVINPRVFFPQLNLASRT